MKYGIYGGSFDPPHQGHLEIALQVRRHLDLDDVIFVPNHRNPIKSRASASAKDRFHMVQLMVSENPGLYVSDAEVIRPGRSFTVDTLEEFSIARPGEIWFIIGADALLGFERWKQPEKIVKLARLAVVARPGLDLDKVLAQLPNWVRDRVDIVPTEANRASSSEIRDLIYQGESADMWLDPDVSKYISECELYRKTTKEPGLGE